jgi:hypothetical protein
VPEEKLSELESAWRSRYAKHHSQLGILLGAAVLGAARSAEQVDQEAGIYPPYQMKWTDAPKSLPPGAKLAVLEGDPNQDGPFVMRLRLPDGYRIPAHTHPKTE